MAFYRLRMAVIAATCCLTSFGGASAQTYWFNSDNRHYYTFEFIEATWEQARLAAMQQSFAGVNGHLATITSSAEQAFVDSLPFGFSSFWLGGFQQPGGAEPNGSWQWITGEPFSYTHWRFGEPNEGWPDEDLLEMFPGGFWNDVGAIDVYWLPRVQSTKRRYIVEFSVPEPAGLFLLVSSTLAVFLIRQRRAWHSISLSGHQGLVVGARN